MGLCVSIGVFVCLCWCVGVFVCWCVCVLVYLCVGVFVCRCVCVFVCWCVGVFVCLCVGWLNVYFFLQVSTSQTQYVHIIVEYSIHMYSTFYCMHLLV